MATASNEELPQGQRHEKVTELMDLVARNPGLVEVSGLEGKDGDILSDEYLMMWFENRRFCNGGVMKKIFVSQNHKVALIIFEDAKVAQRLLDGRYYFMNERVLTLSRPTGHLWDINNCAVTIEGIVPLLSNFPRDSLEKKLAQLFGGVKYRTDTIPVIQGIHFIEGQMILVVFEDFIDALHVIQSNKGKKIHIGGHDGRLKGPVDPSALVVMTKPEVPQNDITMTTANVNQTGGVSTLQSNIAMVALKKTAVKPSVSDEHLQGLAKELGFGITVGDSKDGKSFRLKGNIEEINRFIAWIKSCGPKMESDEAPSTEMSASVSSPNDECQTVTLKKTEVKPSTSTKHLEGLAKELGFGIIVRDSTDGKTFLLLGQPGEIDQFISYVRRQGQEMENVETPVVEMSASANADFQVQEQQPRTLARPKVAESHSFDLEDTLANGTKVFIYRADITKIKVDVIVNAANGYMDHAGGVAKAIARAAGDELVAEGYQKVDNMGEVMVTQNISTTGGRLCRRVIHAVGPRASVHGFECKSLVTSTVLNALKMFSKMCKCYRPAEGSSGIKSIAIPAISSGVYGVPVLDVALATKEAIQIYDEALAEPDRPTSIHLVNILSDTTQTFVEVFRGQYGTGKGIETANNWRINETSKDKDEASKSLGTFYRPRRYQTSTATEASNLGSDVDGPESRQVARKNSEGADRDARKENIKLHTSRNMDFAGDIGAGDTWDKMPEQGHLPKPHTSRYVKSQGETGAQNAMDVTPERGSPTKLLTSRNMDLKDEDRPKNMSENVKLRTSRDSSLPSDVTEDGGKTVGSENQIQDASKVLATMEELLENKIKPQKLGADENSTSSPDRKQLKVDREEASNATRSGASADAKKTSSSNLGARNNPEFQNDKSLEAEKDNPGPDEASKLLGKCFSGFLWIEANKKIIDEFNPTMYSSLEEKYVKVKNLVKENKIKEALLAFDDVAGWLDTVKPSVEARKASLSSSRTTEKSNQDLTNLSTQENSQEEPMDTSENDMDAAGSDGSNSSDSFERIDYESGIYNGSNPYISEDEGSSKGASAKGASTEAEEKDECSICLSEITDPKTLGACKHVFCKPCIDESFKKCGPKCPNCGAFYGEMKGTQPGNGKMTVTRQSGRLPGYDRHTTIVIHYSFPNGIQESCHPNPGQPYSGTNRTAYLPDNWEGRKVEKLLRRAFGARLVFTVGQSATTGRTDTVVWNNIHHKTNMHGGPQKYGYPDPTYLTRVQEELAAFGIK